MANLSALSVLSFFLYIQGSLAQNYLRIQGGNLYYGNNRVFLSGPNIAWNQYGNDFGNGRYAQSGPVLEQWMREISAAGGNSLRIWIHVEGDNTPQFNAQGLVTACDNQGTFLGEMRTFLDAAASANVLIIPVLWNGAVMRNQNYIQLVRNETRLTSYLNNCLTPLVQALANKPALGAWEAVNEFEGSVQIAGNANACYNTTLIGQYGAGWTGNNIPAQEFLRFINRINGAIKSADPKALITCGSWQHHSQNSAFPAHSYNHYTDACLRGAGGAQNGILDFYQMHTYDWQGSFGPNAPFITQASAYQLNKPVVIGEFSADCGANMGVNAMWDHGYNQGYAGLWSWQYNAGGDCSDSKAAQNQGMTRIRSNTQNGVIPINIG